VQQARHRGAGGARDGGAYPLARPTTVTLRSTTTSAIADNSAHRRARRQIYNWADYMWKKVIDDILCEEFNVDYEWTTFNNMSEAIQKMSTGQVADVFFPTTDQISKVAYGKLLQPLNHSYIPNLEANMWPTYQDPFYDQGWLYTVPYAIYTTGVAYRRDVISDDEASAQGWDMVWNPAYKGKAASTRTPGVALDGHASKVDRRNTGDQTVIDQAEKDLAELVDLVTRATISASTKLPDGVDCTRPGRATSSEQWYLNDLNTLGETDVPVLVPRTTEACHNDWHRDPLTAEHGVAHAFLNFMMDKKHAFDNFTWNGYQPPLTSMDADH
jgi:spermidine/putrescine transport system substrate-binding protein